MTWMSETAALNCLRAGEHSHMMPSRWPVLMRSMLQRLDASAQQVLWGSLLMFIGTIKSMHRLEQKRYSRCMSVTCFSTDCCASCIGSVQPQDFADLAIARQLCLEHLKLGRKQCSHSPTCMSISVKFPAGGFFKAPDPSCRSMQ